MNINYYFLLDVISQGFSTFCFLRSPKSKLKPLCVPPKPLLFTLLCSYFYIISNSLYHLGTACVRPGVQVPQVQARSRGLVVKVDGSSPRGCEFEPQHCKLDGCKRCQLLRYKSGYKGSQMGYIQKVFYTSTPG